MIIVLEGSVGSGRVAAAGVISRALGDLEKVEVRDLEGMSSSDLDRVLELVVECKKAGSTLIVTAGSFDKVGKRMRDLADVRGMCKLTSDGENILVSLRKGKDFQEYYSLLTIPMREASTIVEVPVVGSECYLVRDLDRMVGRVNNSEYWVDKEKLEVQ